MSDIQTSESPSKPCNKYGIIYLSSIPVGLNVTLLRQIMSEFGKVGRIYLEPEAGDLKRHRYTEGWVEFEKKRVAKKVAKMLNGTEIVYGRKRCQLNGQVWTIKYLHKFKWAHLIEQSNYYRKTQDQERRFHINQAKKEAGYYEKMNEKVKRKKKDPEVKRPLKLFKQKEVKQNEEEVDDDLLASIFK